jgi:peptidyl-prolyl cis-trans isomerase C
MKKEKTIALLGVMVLTATAGIAADADKPETKSAADAKKLFPDEVLCRGKGVEVRRSQVDEAFLQFKANLTARGQPFPEERREQVEAQLLDRLLVTRLLVSRATDEDRAKAKTLAEKFEGDTRKQAGSDESFERQLRAMGFSAAKFREQVVERAICEEVVDRELKGKTSISDEQAKKFYEENGDQFQRPEMVRASHILLSTRVAGTERDMSEDKKKEKKEQIEKILERARKGEDFAALAKEFSEDPGSKDQGGEYTFPRGQMMPEFEAAAFALKTNEISDIVTTQFGFHIIKLSEKVPPQKIEYAKAEKELKEYLAKQQVQKQLPDFMEKLKKEANLEYLNGAKPPPEPSAVVPTPVPGATP